MTDKLLHGMALQVLNMAKGDLEQGHLTSVLAAYAEGQGLHRMKLVEATIEQMAGKGWLNSGAAKGAVFESLRLGSKYQGPDALVIGTMGARFEPTPAFQALSFEEQQAITNKQHPRDFPAYFQPKKCIIAIAQSPERVCICIQRVENRLLIGLVDIQYCDQSDFGGRLKMYGE